MRIWFDIVNTPHTHFLLPFIKRLREKYGVIITCRDFAETYEIVSKWGINFTVMGRYHGASKIKKIFGVFLRDVQLLAKLQKFDVSISHGSIEATHVSKIRRKKSIVFDDNDKAISTIRLYAAFADFLFYPNAIPLENLRSSGVDMDRLYQYHGFKEDIYIADFAPDPSFVDTLPFSDFVVVRPENLKASYVPSGKISLVPSIIKLLKKENFEILYLPRFKEDAYLAKKQNVFIPTSAVSGLDVAWYSKAVLTGAGTFAREAACMGTPAVSFYLGNELLSVDEEMIRKGWMFHSRDPEEIVEYVLSSKKRKVDLSRSKKVQREVFDIVEGILEEIESKKQKE